ncbi:IS21 family transposase [Desulfobacterales bacterium HSG16]|nr:IS21 family transposase [Desulfobacterales bacterium HSG16]
MSQQDFIRTAHRVYGKSIRQLAKETGHSRNTIRKMLKGEYESYKIRNNQVYPVLGKYVEIIEKWLKSDLQNPRKQRHTARRVYNRLVNEHGFTGAESTVRVHVRKVRMKISRSDDKAFIPLCPPIGQEAEIDWGTASAVIDNKKATIKFFCMRSKYSGKHFVRCYPCERQEALCDAHIHAFEFFGGIFPVLIYDNMTTAVRKVLLGKDRQLQESFEKFKAFYNFEARFCNVGQGHEKGGVEGLVGYSRRNYMVPIPHAESFAKLNEKILQECLNYGSHRISGKKRSVSEDFENEKEFLIALPPYRFSNIRTFNGKADKYATVIVDRNRYSVPTRYAGMAVNIVLSFEQVKIYCFKKLAASHMRVFGCSKWQINPHHYLKLIQKRPLSFDSARPIKEWREKWPDSHESLLKHFCIKQGQNSGIKDFLSVLMMYGEHTAPEMEAAIEKAVESGVSTHHGVKHILFPAKPEESFAPLEGWPLVSDPDVSTYDRLGGEI